MELVPGETLAALLSRGPIPLEESLQICRQIADGLEAAHEKGVVHRDLKPANIKVTPDGRVKILDLGLAKAMELPASDEGLSESPTRTLDQTRPGTILGTVEFMSPEQARGKDVDKRTDIWAFGCVLFEMLSGRRAFTGETASDILASILTKEPDWSALPAATPPRVRELLAHCLQKNANERLRDIGDARSGLERSAEFPSGEAPTAIPARRVGRAAAVVGLILAAGVLGYLLLRPRASPSGPQASDRSLVVLPATVMSDSPGSQLIGDGFVETMSVRLNDVPGIQVVTPAAAVQAADKSSDPFSAARSVGANLLVRSSVVRSGDRLRIIYSVWNVQSRAQVVGGTVEGSASDLFGMQDRLAERVAAQLKLPGPFKKTPTPSGLETAVQQEKYVQALGNLQRYDKPASIDEAIRGLEALADERPEAGLVSAALGRAYLIKFNLTRDKVWAGKAYEAVGRARRLAPESSEVDITLGELAVRTGKPQEAVAAFRRALSMQPNNFDALLGLGRAYDAADDPRNAEATYRRAIQLQPSYWAAYSKLGGFFVDHGLYAKAVEMFNRVTELTPDNARGYSNLGVAEFGRGHFPEALRAFQQSIQIQPTHLAYSNVGTLQFYLGRYSDAAAAFEKAIGLLPGHYELWANLGDAYRLTRSSEEKAQKAYAQAISLAREELQTNPQDGRVNSYLALCLAKTGDLGQADRHVRKSLSAAPGNPEFLFNAAVVANRDHRADEAIEMLRRALAAGFNPTVVRNEPEFVNLRARQDFQKVIRISENKS
jgi:serine/threonine-protein kinase